LALTTLLALFASGYGTPAPTPPAEETPVAPAPAPTPAPEPTPEPPEETSIIVLIQTEPSGFNSLVSDTGLEQFLMEFVWLGLTDLEPQGEFFLELEAELPTQENGGVVVDENAWTINLRWWGDG